MFLGYSGVGNVGEAYWKGLIPAAGREIKIFATPDAEKCKEED